jgi:hypothetical protein
MRIAMRNKTGFTLVEMLVATALVVLMMLMFAQIFQTAAGLVSNQKGMAKQDQNVRTMTILLQGDIKQRTFRDVIPFEPGEDILLIEDMAKRQGFFSISENHPDNQTDDVLHLTITTMEASNEPTNPSLPFSGKAAFLRVPEASGGPPYADLNTNQERLAYLLGDPRGTPPVNNNQPEFDDGQLTINNTGSSAYAEVVWFLRNGNLYRRLLLVRNPYATAAEPQPKDANGVEMIPDDYSTNSLPWDSTTASNNGWQDAVGRFWYDFDYSAFHDPDTTTGGFRFHSVPASLDNSGGSGTGSFGVPQVLGIPCFRYGNSLRRALEASGNAPFGAPPNYPTVNAIAIPPKEYLTAGDAATYIGRYTVQETAHSDFTYPNSSPGGTSDPFIADTQIGGNSLTLDTDGFVSQYATERGRRGEDLVMSNVHSFDIKVWDESASQFVNLDNGGTGDFATLNPNQPFPRNQGGNRYDTWHPSPSMPQPPYRPTNMDGTPKRLRAIEIVMRFYDPGSESMRDLTFTLPLN